MARGIEE